MKELKEGGPSDQDASRPETDTNEVAQKVPTSNSAVAVPALLKLTARRPSEIIQMSFDESDNIVGDRLCALAQFLTILGEGGLGKSRLALQLAVCAITGRDFIGFPTHNKSLRWLIIQGENNNRRLKDDFCRLKAWVGEEDFKKVDEQLVIHTLEEDQDSLLSLWDNEVVKRICDLVAETKPDVICFDSLYCLAMGGELNSDKDMVAVCMAIGRVCRLGNPNRAVIVLHHASTGRSGAAKSVGYDRSSFGRNSKMLQAWTRAQINVAPAVEDGSVLIIACGKNSNGKPFEPFAIRLNPETMIYEVDSGFDVKKWASEIRSPSPRRQGVDPGVVAKLCAKPLKREGLIAAFCAKTGLSAKTAYRYIKSALDEGNIEVKEDGNLIACGKEHSHTTSHENPHEKAA